MKLRTVLDALKTPDCAEGLTLEQLMEMEVSFATANGEDLGLLSVYVHEGEIIVDVGN